MRNRYLFSAIQQDALAKGKMAFISGPRQVGKTTLGEAFLKNAENNFNYDDPEFRKSWLKNPYEALCSRSEGAILLDEIHKDYKWKSKLKGLYDLKLRNVPIIVTGSARLDFYRRGGDSMMGRYIPYRLHPFSVGENNRPISPDEILQNEVPKHRFKDIFNLSGFPEPFFEQNEKHAQRWSRLRRDRIVYEDVRDFRQIQSINALHTLTDLLPERVGSLFSHNNLREILGVSATTVKEWINILEVLFYCFKVTPYSKKLSRMISAEPKIYLYDILQITQPEKRLENILALHLLKAAHYWTDLAYGNFKLHFLRNKDGREVDFLLLRDEIPWMLVECKSNSEKPSSNLIKFSEQLKTAINIQTVTTSSTDKIYKDNNIRVMNIEKFLAGLI